MTSTLIKWQQRSEGFARAEAEVLKTLNLMAEKYPLEFAHGMTKKEVKEKFELLVKQGKFERTLTIYDNKMRSLYKKGLAGRHTVHGERHYFAVTLHEEGLVNHSRCVDCEVVGGKEEH